MASSELTYDAERATRCHVELVFANVRDNKRLDRFTLRGRTIVNGQWLLFYLVHNIEKIGHAGYAA